MKAELAVTKIDLLADLPGFRDFYPMDWWKIDYVLTNMRNVAKRYGYEEYEGPSVEALELIEAKSGPSLMGEVFSFKDKRQRRLLLRPEQTPTLARMLAKQQQRYKRPIRWFAIPRLFRDETTQKGREREFWQLNVDILGESDLVSDAEVMAVGIDILRECGIEDDRFVVYVNNRKFLSSVIKDNTTIKVQSVIRIIDKKAALTQSYVFDKLKENGEDEKTATSLSLLFRRIVNSTQEFKDQLLIDCPDHVKAHVENIGRIEERVMINAFTELGIESQSAHKIFEITKISGPPIDFVAKMKALDLNKISLELLQEFEKLGTHLKSMKVDQPVIFDASLARGLDYYTGFVFEIFDATGELVRALLGGGRYDNLIEVIGGQPLSGTGFGMGDVTTLQMINIHSKFPDTIQREIDFYLAPINQKTKNDILELASRIRNNFIIVCNAFKWKLGRHFELADSLKAKFVLLLGPKDVETKQISVRNMVSSEQFQIELDDHLEENLRSLL